MDEITIKYWSPHGRQEETKFQRGHTKIDMVMRAAKRVDLRNLSRCHNLKKLDLSHNMLEELDLSPLAECASLEEIYIQSNHLTRLNLWSLENNSKLVFIDTTENRLHGLDLTPIFLETKVRMDSSVVVTADNILRYIFTKDELVEQFQLLRSDKVSWAVPPVIIWNMYSNMTKKNDWAQIKHRINTVLQKMNPLKWYGAQRGLLQGLDISMMGGFDGDPNLLIDSAVMKMSYEEARQEIFDTSVKLIEEQLHQDGPTLFLDVEEMRETSASKLIPLIVEKRHQEVENSTLFIKGSKVFLKPLWLTHYGFIILSAHSMGLITDLQGLESLQDSFDELDIELTTEKVNIAKDEYEGNASQSMQEHVFNFISGAYH